jgi:hypothetical protein
MNFVYKQMINNVDDNEVFDYISNLVVVVVVVVV